MQPFYVVFEAHMFRAVFLLSLKALLINVMRVTRDDNTDHNNELKDTLTEDCRAEEERSRAGS